MSDDESTDRIELHPDGILFKLGWGKFVAIVVAVFVLFFGTVVLADVLKDAVDKADVDTSYPLQHAVNSPIPYGEAAVVEGLLCSDTTTDVALTLSWTAVQPDGDPIEGASVTSVVGVVQTRPEGCEWHGSEARCEGADRCLSAFVNSMPSDVVQLDKTLKGEQQKHRWIIQGFEQPPGGFPITFKTAPFDIGPNNA